MKNSRRGAREVKEKFSGIPLIAWTGNEQNSEDDAAVSFDSAVAFARLHSAVPPSMQELPPSPVMPPLGPLPLSPPQPSMTEGFGSGLMSP